MWPSTSTEKLPEYVVVTYPGVVKNAEKAIETLGGAQTLSMASGKNVTRNFQRIRFNYRIVVVTTLPLKLNIYIFDRLLFPPCL